MQDPDRREAYLATARTKPSLLLKGATPRLIDEWQVAPVMIVLTGGEMAYTREDGVKIVPIGCLRD